MTAIMIMNDSININLHFWQALPLSLIASFFLFYHHLVLVAPNKKIANTITSGSENLINTSDIHTKRILPQEVV